MLQGLSPVLTKLLLIDGLSREAVLSARYLLAFMLLAPIGAPSMARREPGLRPRPGDWIALFLVGALGSGIGALLFTAALEYSSAGVVNSISKTAPVFVAVLGYVMLRERVTSARLLLVGAMVGADVLIGLGELAFDTAEARARLLGDGLALLAGVTRATAEILAKGTLRRFAPSTVTMWRFGSGFLVTGGLAAYTGAYRELAHLNAHGLAILGTLAGVSTALSMYLYYRGTAKIPVHVAVSLKILGAVVTVIVSWIVLRETLNLYHVTGIGLLISGAYLLVMRTARETAGPEVGERAPAATPAPVRGGFRVRLTLLVAGFTVATVIVATVLSVRHTNAMVSQQIRLTMGKLAAAIVQLQGVEDPPSRHTLQQYLRRIVRHRIEDELYSVDIVYVAMTDEDENVLAFAVNEELALVDEAGRPYRAGDLVAAQRLMAMADSGALGRKYDITPVRAELRRGGGPGDVVAVVEIGCKRSLAGRVLAEIAARNVVLVLILVAIVVTLAAALVRRLTNPLERLALAMQRLSGGDLDMPFYSEGGGEVGEMGESLQTMRENLRMADALRRALVRYAAVQIGQELPAASAVHEESAPTARTVMFVEVPLQALAEGAENGARLPEFVDTIVTAVLHNDGEIDRWLDGSVIAQWSGGGEEDALWATLAAIELRGKLADLLPEAGPCLRIGVEVADLRAGPLGARNEELREARARVLDPVSDQGGAVEVLLGERAMAEVAEHVIAERQGEEPVWRLINLTASGEFEGFSELVED